MPYVQRQRPRDEHPDHPGPDSAGVADGAADQAQGQGSPRRARRAGRRPVRPRPCHTAPGLRALGRQPDGHRAGDRAGCGAGFGDQGAVHRGARSRSGFRLAPRTAGPSGPRKGIRRSDGTFGDLLVTVEVQVPKNVAARAARRWKKLREATAGEDPREELLQRAKEA